MENFKYVFEIPQYQPAFVTILAVVVGLIFTVYVFFKLVDRYIARQVTGKRALSLTILSVLVFAYTSMIALAYDKSSWIEPKHDKVLGTLIKGSVYKSIVNQNNKTSLYCGRYALEDGSGREVDPCLTTYNLSNDQKPVEKIVLYKLYTDAYSRVRWYP